MTIAVKRVDDHRNDITVKRNGKVMISVQSVVSKDGNTMINTADGWTQKGEKFHQVEVILRNGREEGGPPQDGEPSSSHTQRNAET